MFVPEPIKLNWWKRLILRWRMFWFSRRGFRKIQLPCIDSPLPEINMNDLAQIQPIDPTLGAVFMAGRRNYD